MQTFMRVEFSTGIGYKAARFVVLTELPENVLAEIQAQKLSPQSRAGKIKNLDALGEPAFVAEDGCKAWVIRKPGTDHSGAYKKPLS
jgi:hypothetical protein